MLLNVGHRLGEGTFATSKFDLCLHFYLAFSITTTHFYSLFTIFTFITSDGRLGVQLVGVMEGMQLRGKESDL